jgi:hypothetical protein
MDNNIFKQYINVNIHGTIRFLNNLCIYAWKNKIFKQFIYVNIHGTIRFLNN